MDIASTLNTIHDFSYPSLFHGGMAAKDLSPGVNIGVWDTRRTYFQSPWRNFGVGFMRNAPWGISLFWSRFSWRHTSSERMVTRDTITAIAHHHARNPKRLAYSMTNKALDRLIFLPLEQF